MMVERLGTEARDRAVLVAGAVLGIVGGLGYFVLLLVHGDLPDQTTMIALQHIASRPEWALLKWLLIACVVCWVGAFAMLAHSFRGATSWVLGHLAAATVTLGAALVLVEYSVLGYGLRNIAVAWASAAPAEQESLLIAGDALLGVTGGLFLNFVTWLIGVPFLVMGLAVSREPGYPRWHGWIAVAGGTGAVLSGSGRFLDAFAIPFPVIYGGFVVPLVLWLAGTGFLMLRRARSLKGLEPAVAR